MKNKNNPESQSETDLNLDSRVGLLPHQQKTENPLIATRHKLIYFSLFSLVFCIIDFYFSNLISFKLLNGGHFSSKILKLVYVENTGAAFSIMQNSTIFLIFLSIIAIILLFYMFYKNIEAMVLKDVFLLSLLFSGIVGNLYERIFFEHVRDFFELTFINFPIFNISDIFINISVISIIILLLLTKKPIKFV